MLGTCQRVLLAVLVCATAARAADFPGWQVMRVIEQEGLPTALCGAVLYGDGRHQLIVVNTRHSRLDIYRWLDDGQREESASSDPDRPNELPMAPDFERDEIPLEHLPQDVVVQDLDRDGRPELVILVSPPNQVVVYEQDETRWQRRHSFDLLPGEIGSQDHPILLRQWRENHYQLLVSFSDGIQTLDMAQNSRAEWISPRERRDRMDWWLADLDGDGDQDLIEQSRESEESLRWYACDRHGELAPAQVLFDRAINDASVLNLDKGVAHLMLLDGATRGLLRHYRMILDEPTLLGQHRALAIEGGTKAVWCGMRLGDESALVIADREHPRVLTYLLTDEGWKSPPGHSAYPVISDVRAIAAPQGAAGTLLLWAKDAADLQQSRWEGGRLTYPKPKLYSQDIEDRKILALATTGSTTWWVQRVGADLDLYRWPASQVEPTVTRFDGAGKTEVSKRKQVKAEKVLWLGGDQLLVQDRHAREVKLVMRTNDQVTITEPSRLKKANFYEFTIIAVGDELRPARLTDGVLQWLGEDLHSVDQMMLPQGKKLIGYVATSVERGWALQDDGQYIHLMESEDSGLSRVTKSIKLMGGVGILHDPVLGLMLIDHNRVEKLNNGQTTKLDLVSSIDQRIGRPSGVKESTIHRVRAADVLGDGRDELILFDDRRHQLTVLAEVDGEFQPQISWPVFEDKKYPYGGDDAPLVHQPRAVAGLDFDGDGVQDLAMACHDRLIFYLARKSP